MMEKDGLKGIFLIDPSSIAYTAGIWTAQTVHWKWTTVGLLLPREGEATVICADGPEISRISEETWVRNFKTWSPPLADSPEVSFTEAVMSAFSEQRLDRGRVGLEFIIPASRYFELKQRLPDVEFVDVSEKMENVMLIKDEEEIALMRRVAEIADMGVKAGFDAVNVGMSENELAGVAEYAMRKAGMDLIWSSTHVSSGYKFQMDRPSSDKLIQLGDAVKIDVHPAYRLYRNDLCATAILGTPTSEYRRICDVAIDAAYAMIDAMVPGVTAGDVDKVFRSKMEKAGLRNFSRWTTGHGLGTGHLPPRMHSKDKTKLQPNMTIDLNAEVIKPGQNGFMIESMVLMTNEKPELLNKTPLTLVELHR